MDRRTLSRIDEELDSSEVAELCFLCSDVVNRRRLEGITDGKTLFMRLEEKGLLENSSFLCQLLQIIHRADLLNQLQNDYRQQEETDANPILSAYRVMLYDIYKDMTEENFEKIKFMLNSKLGRRQLEMSKTVLDVFVEMEKTGLMSQRDVTELHALLQDLDVQLAGRVERYTQALPPQIQHIPSGSFSIDQQRPNVASLAPLSSLSIQDNQSIYDLPVSASESLLPSSGEERSICTDALPKVESSSLSDEGDYYSLSHMPRGLCVIINNEVFPDTNLRKRQGTQEDESLCCLVISFLEALHSVFERLGFEVVTHRDLTAERIRVEMAKLGKRNFSSDDALVIAVLSHGDMGCIFGSDEKKVPLQDLTGPFKTGRAITLARKPKLFFIQACQGSEYQKGSVLRHPANKLDSEEN
ncbi:unnamed protein product, partial [Menidia menidia]